MARYETAKQDRRAKNQPLLGFPKPGEFIEMTGTHMLEASDRAVFNLLYQHAHDSGRLLDPSAEWEMPLNTSARRYPATITMRGCVKP